MSGDGCIGDDAGAGVSDDVTAETQAMIDAGEEPC